MIDTPLAHSTRHDRPAQTYSNHIIHVRRCARANAKQATVFYTGDQERFIESVDAAALVHDLGKLDQANQEILRGSSQEALPVFHEDAGVAALWKHQRKESAVLVAGHHAGLFSKSGELPPNKKRMFRDERPSDALHEGVVDMHIDAHLQDYLEAHKVVGLPTPNRSNDGRLHRCGFTRRIALSCLVDADHGDTARHYGGEVETPEVDTRWEKRAAALQRYVNAMPKGKSDRERRRNILRRNLFEACWDAPIDPPIRACDAPVGSGKTTAVMAHLLRVASEKRLRHIFVILPYTNIITQSVEVYRKALVLEGERPEDIVAEHHHQADFEDLELRQLATLWKAPIIVTTAVQFFETLGSHRPSRLRKLHELPGSAVFVDEMHAAIPSHLWPQMWRWLTTWSRDWGGHLVLASGSLPRFWELEEYRQLIQGETGQETPAVADLVSDDALNNEANNLEKKRIRYHRRPEGTRALDCDALIQFVTEKPGPRLLIVNTVQTAAEVARIMRDRGHDVLHLSTALAPVHRCVIVERIKLRLCDKVDDWTLVATSCVEAGMDFSFRTGFRERASTASLIQIGGRISRGDEHEDAQVWDLLLRDDILKQNPALNISRQALDGFDVNELNDLSPAELATCGMQREWTAGAEEKAKKILDNEKSMEYPHVADLCRVIDTDTRTVVIDPQLVHAIQENKKVSKTELLRYSVQIWATKVNRLCLEPIDQSRELYAWDYDYDPDCLGYMAGVFRIEDFKGEGGAII